MKPTLQNLVRTFAAKITVGSSVPTERLPAMSPRGEPTNFSAGITVSAVQSAIRLAENGDPKDLFRIYRDSVLSDDHVQGCFNTRKLAVLGQPLAVMPRRKNNTDDIAAAGAVNRAIEDCENWSDALGAILDSTLWPVSVGEKTFRPANTPDDEPNDGQPKLQYTLKRIEPVNPAMFCWKWAYSADAKIDREQWEPLFKLWPLDENGLIQRDAAKAEYLDPVRHIVHRGHLLTGFKDNWGGPMRAILFWWLLRGLGRDWFGRFMERYGAPFVKGKTNTKDPQAVAFLQEAFSLATKIAGIVIGQDDEVELVQAVVQGGADGHKLWHDVCNNAISRHITGNETTGGSSPAGLNAGASSKAENVREDFRMFDQMKLADTLEKQLVLQFLRINGLKGKVKLSFGGLSDDDAGTFATTLNTLSQAGFEPTEEAIPTINERLGIPVQRKAISYQPSAISSGFSNPQSAIDNPATLMARLFTLAAQIPKATHPTDRVAAENKQRVGDAMIEAFAPAVQIVRDAKSPREAETRLAAFFADWRPKQFVAAIEKPLQVCAAEGAAVAKPK